MTSAAEATTDTATPAPGAPPVIDMCGLVFDRECWRAYFLDLGPAYLRTFGGKAAVAFGADPALVRRHLDRGDPAAAVDVLVAGVPEAFDLDGHLRELDAQGVTAEVVIGADHRLPDGGTVNDRVADIAAGAPRRLQPWAGLTLADPDAALAEAERCADRGLRGLAMTPFWDGVDPARPEYAKVFAFAEARGLPVWLHAGHHFAAGRPYDLSHPRTLDILAARHPDLVLIAGHGGWPWVLDTVAIAMRHPNVHIDISTHRPGRMAVPGSGWEPLLCYGRGPLRDRVLFGTARWAHAVPTGVLVREVLQLGLGDEVAHDWLFGNAARITGLTGTAGP